MLPISFSAQQIENIFYKCKKYVIILFYDVNFKVLISNLKFRNKFLNDFNIQNYKFYFNQILNNEVIAIVLFTC